MILGSSWARTGAPCLLTVAVLLGCSRVTGLPAVPASITRADAGLDGLARAADRARELLRPLESATGGVEAWAGLVQAEPANLAVGNAFRMEVYRRKRAFLKEARERGVRSPVFPDELRAEPLATLNRVASSRPGREVRTQIALSYVDQMFLDPALEVRAPASIDSVHEFSAILADRPYDVPALVGRGLNYLNRPLKLVWPEHPAPPADAASRDLALAAAVGARVGGASPRVKGFLLLLLGDAYAHEGKAGLARSWWTLAGEATDDRGIHAELAIRAGWPEPEMPARIEARLEERMDEVDAPVSDLSFLWDDGARGPW
jgi:hypothetical protein